MEIAPRVFLVFAQRVVLAALMYYGKICEEEGRVAWIYAPGSIPAGLRARKEASRNYVALPLLWRRWAMRSSTWPASPGLDLVLLPTALLYVVKFGGGSAGAGISATWTGRVIRGTGRAGNKGCEALGAMGPRRADGWLTVCSTGS